MARIGRILGGLAVAALIIGIFVATQIADTHGRTLADRVPVLGPVVRAMGFGAPGGGRPMFQAMDEPAAIVDNATCGAFIRGDERTRLTVADALIEVGAREDGRFRRVDPGRVVEALTSACAGVDPDLFVVDAIARAATR